MASGSPEKRQKEYESTIEWLSAHEWSQLGVAHISIGHNATLVTLGLISKMAHEPLFYGFVEGAALVCFSSSVKPVTM